MFTGCYQDTVVLPSGGRQTLPWRSNLVVSGCYELVAGLLKGEAGVHGILWWALGDGTGATAVDDLGLARERHRQRVLPAHISFLDGQGASTTTPSSRLLIHGAFSAERQTTGGETLKAIELTEFGLFGWRASETAGSGTLINRVVHAPLKLADGAILERRVVLSFGFQDAAGPQKGQFGTRLPVTSLIGVTEDLAEALATLGIDQLGDLDLAAEHPVNLPAQDFRAIVQRARTVRAFRAPAVLSSFPWLSVLDFLQTDPAELAAGSGLPVSEVREAQAELGGLELALTQVVLERMSLGGVVDGGEVDLGAPQPRILIDSSELSPTTVTIVPGIGNLGQGRHALELEPGAYRVRYATGAGRGEAAFDVTEERFVHVAFPYGTVLVASASELRVRGWEVAVATGDLSAQSIVFAGVTGAEPKGNHTLRLLPGLHRIYYTTGAGRGSVDFELMPDGEISVDPADARIASVDGAFLAVSGLPVQVDTGPLTAASIVFNGVTGNLPTGLRPLALLPGAHRLYYGTGAGRGSADFELAADGGVKAIPPYGAVLTVEEVDGQPRLTTHGITVQIDTGDLSVPQVVLNGATGAEPVGTREVTLLPGAHRLYYGTGAGRGFADFELTPDASFRLEAPHDQVLDASGDTLKFVGVAVTVDSSPLSVPWITFNGVTGAVAKGEAQLVLLPGDHRIYYAIGGTRAYADFLVTVDGVALNAPHDQVLSADGPLLTVTGATVSVDATDAPEPIEIGPINLAQGSPHTLHLLPGEHTLAYTNQASVAPLRFTLAPDGSISYPAQHEFIFNAQAGNGIQLRIPTLKTAPTHPAGEPIEFTFAGLTTAPGFWVGIYPKGAPRASENLVDWLWTTGTRDNKTPGPAVGTLTFPAQQPNRYEARVFLSNYAALAAVEFEVKV
ncbi:MAG: hypothetical protein OXR73_38495 [Myxococcales bacterium]|nr:hypothetical protein [Myxococcales bacterium]